MQDTAHGLVLRGRALLDLGRSYEAADSLERASPIGPISNVARMALASNDADLRRVDLALDLDLQLTLSRRVPDDLMLQIAAGLAAVNAPQLAAGGIERSSMERQ